MLPNPEHNKFYAHFKKELWIFRGQWKWFIFISVATYFHNVSTNLAYYIHTPAKVLWDAGFHLIPEVDTFHSINDVIIDVFIGLACVYFCYPVLFLWRESNPRMYTATIFIRIFKIMTFVEIFRSITFLSTSLPGPSPHCQSDSDHYNPPINWKQILFRIDATEGCGDLIYSGHESTVIAFVIVIIHYSIIMFPERKYWKYIIYFALIIFIFMFDVFILSARSHYTVDVVVATYFVPSLYYCLWNLFPDIQYDDIIGVYSNDISHRLINDTPSNHSVNDKVIINVGND